jgi:hypothetical protein
LNHKAITVTRALAGSVLAGAVLATPVPAPATAAPVNPRLAVSVTDGSSSIDGPVTPMIIGGKLVDPGDESYRGVGSFQHLRGADPNWHRCAVWLWADQEHAVTNAHCVTAADGTPLDPGRFHIRFGSTNRLSGGVVVGVKRIHPTLEWDWGTGTDMQADAAMLELTARVPYKGYRTPPWTKSKDAQVVGWGLTGLPWEGPAPTDLAYLDSQVADSAMCVAAAIGAGEICIDHAPGTGVCFGDSGGPALQRPNHHPRYRNTWAVIGGASRETSADCTGPTVYTDWRFWAGWLDTVARTGVVPPAPGGSGKKTAGAPTRTYLWVGAGPLL